MTVSPVRASVDPWKLQEARRSSCEPSPLFRVEQLALSYGATMAFHDLSMTIHRGCITAIVGPSGCGKTSFLMCLNRLTDMIPRCRVSGRLAFDDLDVLSPRLDVLALRRRIGMIFQKPNPFPLSIRKNLVLPLREHGLRDRGQQQRCLEAALQGVGLWDEVKDRLDDSALLLSGGQQQRLCLARALILSPDVLLLDEPCSALDPLSSGVIEDFLLSLRQRYTIVIVTHNLSQARRLADYVAVFWSCDGVGRLVEYGPACQIFESPRHELTASYIHGIRG